MAQRPKSLQYTKLKELKTITVKITEIQQTQEPVALEIHSQLKTRPKSFQCTKFKEQTLH